MSHTFHFKETQFTFNGDLSGDVTIHHGGQRLDVPGDALIAFIASHIANEQIAWLETADHRNLLGLPPRRESESDHAAFARSLLGRR